MTPKQMLAIIAGGLAVVGMIWPNGIIVAAAVLLIAVATFLP